MSPPEVEANSRGSDGLNGQELYVVIRKAVEDAILEIIGTLLLLGVALALVWAGIAIAFSGTTFGLVAGIVAIGCGVYFGAATLRIILPIQKWF
ncbi:hypothetical protein ACFFQF_19910 [Haladaptatus pallidirubidus]|uniref:Major facilitator superfamily (MFS) profile domain-containing protein n=1 Tax=Haladaptatus pallidirubidus TaxID=1008152 RepID=A0AAV3UP63_9EURY|nr:hypothetical protein [Haladaptatus pallidirubidus]